MVVHVAVKKKVEIKNTLLDLLKTHFKSYKFVAQYNLLL